MRIWKSNDGELPGGQEFNNSKPAQDKRFIAGRCVEILINNQRCGIMGELHPVILENWNIEMPCAVAKIDISQFIP